MLLQGKRRNFISLVIFLHKKGQYYIVHFKELFALDGKRVNLSDNDIQRRNRIIKLLSDWGLVEIVKDSVVSDAAPLSQIKVIAYKEKGDWIWNPNITSERNVKQLNHEFEMLFTKHLDTQKDDVA